VQLSCTHAQLQANPACLAACFLLSIALEVLQDHEQWRVDGQQVRSRVLWRAQGDRGSCEFFHATKQRAIQTSITELQDSSGTSRTCQPGLETICFDFYSQLYTRREANVNMATSQSWAFEGTYSKLSLEMIESLA
jgi:hypothetical protein